MNPDVTQGEVLKLVIRLQLTEHDNLSVYRGVLDSEVLYVHKISRAFETKEPSIACQVLHT